MSLCFCNLSVKSNAEVIPQDVNCKCKIQFYLLNLPAKDLEISVL